MPPPTESTRRPPLIIGARTNPRARVRSPKAAFSENEPRGRIHRPSRIFAARLMFVTRGAQQGNLVVNAPTTRRLPCGAADADAAATTETATTIGRAAAIFTAPMLLPACACFGDAAVTNKPRRSHRHTLLAALPVE